MGWTWKSIGPDNFKISFVTSVWISRVLGFVNKTSDLSVSAHPKFDAATPFHLSRFSRGHTRKRKTHTEVTTVRQGRQGF